MWKWHQSARMRNNICIFWYDHFDKQSCLYRVDCSVQLDALVISVNLTELIQVVLVETICAIHYRWNKIAFELTKDIHYMPTKARCIIYVFPLGPDSQQRCSAWDHSGGDSKPDVHWRGSPSRLLPQYVDIMVHCRAHRHHCLHALSVPRIPCLRWLGFYDRHDTG